MIFFLILSHIFLFSNQNKFIEKDGKIVEKIFMEDSSSYNDEDKNNISIKGNLILIQ